MFWLLDDALMEQNRQLIHLMSSDLEWLFMPFGVWGKFSILNKSFSHDHKFIDPGEWHQYTFTLYQDPVNFNGRVKFYLDGIEASSHKAVRKLPCHRLKRYLFDAFHRDDISQEYTRLIGSPHWFLTLAKVTCRLATRAADRFAAFFTL